MSILVNEKLEALRIKAKIIRQHIIRMIGKAGSGHPGGSLSAVEIMTALYFYKMKINPVEPKWKYRDYFLMSKGHAAPVWYATLAVAGYFPVSELDNLRSLGSILQGHPDMKRTPGVEMSSGSLGQGLSVANGIALASKTDKKVCRIYVLLGDGEMQEGQIWEAAMAAAHYRLDNLCAILDNNGFQIDGPIDRVMSPLPLDEKWKAFGWNVINVDGHNLIEIINALNQAEMTKNKPTIIIARTTKGKGVSFMENKAEWHGKAPTKEETEKALKELE
jgi:transketolase